MKQLQKLFVFAFQLLKGPIAWFIMFCFIKILYTMAPDRKLSSANVNFGAVFTTVMWVIVTWQGILIILIILLIMRYFMVVLLIL